MYYTTEQLGPKRSITPEGFLICHDVPIGRTGTQLYSALEIPNIESPNGEVRVVRDADQVFRAETLASFEGKPVTLAHPDEFVSPDNWSSFAVGTVQNVKQGPSPFDDLIIADLVITRRDAIDAIDDGLREVSCGYDANYEQVERGKARQVNIIGNHVALVERGRAGSRCAIQDEATTVSTKDKAKFWDRIQKAFTTKDEAEVKAAMEDEENDPMSKIMDALGAIGERITQLEISKTADADEPDDKKVEDADPEDPTEDEESEEEKAARESEDMLITPESAPKADTGRIWTGDALREVIARAEILAPGIAIPTADGELKAPAVAVAKLQRVTLSKALQTEDGRKVVEPFLKGRDLQTMDAANLDAVFIAAAELMGARNNNSMQRRPTLVKDSAGAPKTVAEINAANRAHWGRSA